MKNLILFVIALFAIVSNDAFSQDRLEAVNPNRSPVVLQNDNAAAILWDNTAINTTTSGIVSTQLRGRHPDSTTVKTADDFVIPAGITWNIDSIYAPGFYSATAPAIADSVAIEFYTNSATNKPGTLIRKIVVPNTNDTIKVKLQVGLTLTAGTYWVSVYNVFNTATALAGARWNWYTGSIAKGLEGQIKDNTGSFGPPFDWTALSALGVTQPSCNFAIYGTAGTPPAPSDTILVVMHDSTAGTAAEIGYRKADRDTLMRSLVQITNKPVKMHFTTTTSTPPDLTNYKFIIIQETSFDATTVRVISPAFITALKAWLNSGTPTSKKALYHIGGDLGYNYQRTGGAGTDLDFSQNYGKYVYKVDNGTVTGNLGILSIPGGLRENLVTSSTFWPDGCSAFDALPTTVKLYSYAGHTANDTLAAIGNNATNFVVASQFQDPRYFGGTGDPGTQPGFTRAMRTMINWIQASGSIILGTENNYTSVPNAFSLSQNYPNPFNPTTNINFTIPKSGVVSLKVYDMLGKEVMTLVNEFRSAGAHTVNFNASRFASGTYFYRLETNGFVDVKKMMLVK